MIVAMIAVRVVQVSVHQVIDVVAVRDRRMSAARPVDVFLVVTRTHVSDATVGVSTADLDRMFVVVILVGAVEVTVVKVADVVSVLNRHVTAARAMLVVVIFVNFVRHGFCLRNY